MVDTLHSLNARRSEPGGFIQFSERRWRRSEQLLVMHQYGGLEAVARKLERVAVDLQPVKQTLLELAEAGPVCREIAAQHAVVGWHEIGERSKFRWGALGSVIIEGDHRSRGIEGIAHQMRPAEVLAQERCEVGYPSECRPARVDVRAAFGQCGGDAVEVAVDIRKLAPEGRQIGMAERNTRRPARADRLMLDD